jgi:hypothetical protein
LNESLAQTTFDTRNESGAGFEDAARGVAHSMSPSDRFFLAAILGGRLHVRDIPDRGPWDSSRIGNFTESYIDPGLVGAAGDRKVRPKEELEAAIKEPMKVSPTPKRVDSRKPFRG